MYHCSGGATSVQETDSFSAWIVKFRDSLPEPRFTTDGVRSVTGLFISVSFTFTCHILVIIESLPHKGENLYSLWKESIEFKFLLCIIPDELTTK